MTNSEIDKIIDSQQFSVAYDEIHAAVHQLSYATQITDSSKALSYIESAETLLKFAKTKIRNHQINSDCSVKN